MGTPRLRKAPLAMAEWRMGRESEGVGDPPRGAAVGTRKFLGPAF